MAQQTSGKKDREKKKLTKRKDKEQKREERKANSNKGKGFEEMFAYVDEFGQLTSTPPDPTKKTNVSLADIQIGVPKKVEAEPLDIVRKGTVTFFNQSKGYGFIKDHETQESIFVHVNGLIDPINENDKVIFETERGHKGLIAVKVTLGQ